MLNPFSKDAIKSVTAKFNDSKRIGDLFTTVFCLLMVIRTALNRILKKHINIITGQRYVYNGLRSGSPSFRF